MKYARWTALRLLLVGLVVAITVPFAAISLLPMMGQTVSAQAEADAEDEEAEAEDEEATDEVDIDEEAEDEEAEAGELEPVLVTATTHGEMVQFGRSLMTARGNHWVWDSIPPINGPNEEVNPMDAFLGALIACSMFIYEAVGIEQDIEISALSAQIQGELDPRGVAGFPVDPRLRGLAVTVYVEGPTPEEAAMMAEQVTTRCPIYTTLARSVPIVLVNVIDGEEWEGVATEPLGHEEDADVDAEEELQLARPMAAGEMVQPGRAIMTARGNHWVYDSVPPINGPNEELNPLDAFIGALPACAMYIYEAVGIEQDIPIDHLSATVEADLDPRGVAGLDVDPRVREFRLTLNVAGPTEDEAAMMAEAVQTRCPIFTTLGRAAPIHITNNVIGTQRAGVVLQVGFTYDLDADAYVAEVAPLAEFFAAVEGLSWKIWIINEDENRAGGIFLFEHGDALVDFLESDLFEAVATHPDLSDYSVEMFHILEHESAITYGPIR